MQSPVEGGARRKSLKKCPAGKVRGSKSKRCHFRRKAGPHRKSAPSSARRLRGGEQPIVGGAVPAIEPVLTAGALEEAFQAGLEAGRAFRGGLEIDLAKEAVASPLAGGADAPAIEAGARRRRSAKKSHKKSHKKGSKKARSHKKSGSKRSHRGRKHSRRA